MLAIVKISGNIHLCSQSWNSSAQITQNISKDWLNHTVPSRLLWFSEQLTCFLKRHRMTHAPKHLMSIWCQGEMFKFPGSWQTTKTSAMVKHGQTLLSQTSVFPSYEMKQSVCCLLGSSKSCMHESICVSFHGSPREIHLERISFPNRRLVQSRKRHKGETVLARGVSKRSSSSPFRGSVSTPLWIRSKYLPDGVNTLASSWQWARQVQCILKIKIKNDQNRYASTRSREAKSMNQ